MRVEGGNRRWKMRVEGGVKKWNRMEGGRRKTC